MYTYLLVALGSALGGVTRHYGSTLAVEKWGTAFPWGTLIINMLGSFIIGFVASLSDPEGYLPLAPETRLFLMAGFCGGFTTFSTFSLQTLDLMQNGQWLAAGGNIMLSVGVCIVAAWLGHLLA